MESASSARTPGPSSSTDEDYAGVAAVAADGHIRDRGAPAAQCPPLFERSYRSDASRSAEGSGLGPAIARLIAEAHGGGTIRIAGTEGLGAAVSGTLPG